MRVLSMKDQYTKWVLNDWRRRTSLLQQKYNFLTFDQMFGNCIKPRTFQYPVVDLFTLLREGEKIKKKQPVRRKSSVTWQNNCTLDGKADRYVPRWLNRNVKYERVRKESATPVGLWVGADSRKGEINQFTIHLREWGGTWNKLELVKLIIRKQAHDHYRQIKLTVSEKRIF